MVEGVRVVRQGAVLDRPRIGDEGALGVGARGALFMLMACMTPHTTSRIPSRATLSGRADTKLASRRRR